MRRLQVIYLTIGIGSILSQTLIWRQFFSSFWGNELIIGWLFLIWLLSCGLGSLSFKRKSTIEFLTKILLLLAISLPFIILALFLLPHFLSPIRGELQHPLVIFFISCIFLPIPWSFGLLFGVALREREKISKRGIEAICIYFYEGLGFIIGAFIGTFLLYLHLSSLLIATLFSLYLISISIWLTYSKRRLHWYIILGSVILIPYLIEGNLKRIIWRPYQLIYEKDTLYGRITLFEYKKAPFVLYNNSLLTSFAYSVEKELFLYLPYLSCESKNINLLLCSGGDLLPYIVKLPRVNRVYYSEVDAAVISLFKSLLPLWVWKKKKFIIIPYDVRKYVSLLELKGIKLFDIILLKIPFPTSANLNRFYTLAFFRILNNLLKDEGVLVLSLPGTETYLKEDLKQLNLIIYSTLKRIFPHLYLIGGEENIFLCSKNKLNLESHNLWVKIKKEKLKPQFLSLFYLNYRLNRDNPVYAKLAELNSKKYPINTDFLPKAYLFGVLWQLAHFKFPFSLTLVIISIFLSLSFFIPVGYFLLKRRVNLFLPLLTAIAGYTALGAEILLLLLFQAKFGFLYLFYLALTAAFMIGMAFSSGLLLLKVRNTPEEKMKKIASAIIRWIPLKFAIFSIILAFAASFGATSYLFYFTSITLFGVFIGLIFPAVCLIREDLAELFYFCDLAGASLAALYITLIFLFFFGINYNFLILGLILGIIFIINFALPKLFNIS
jgi:spermidine synthase